jgi:menaquinone-dependent protoporphyrinogen oxidase
MFSKNISKDLLESAICYDTFGGEMDINKQKGFDKFIVKMVTKNKDSKQPEILSDNIEKFAKKIIIST